MNENEIIKVVDKEIAVLPQLDKIETVEIARDCGDVLDKICAVRKKIKAFFRPDIDAANALHKSLLEKMKAIDARPAVLEERFRRLLADWTMRENERVAAERAEAEAKAKAAAIKAAKDMGDKALVKDIKAGIVPIVSAPIREPEKIAGVSLRESYAAEVFDLRALCKAVAVGRVTSEYVEANMPVLNGLMRHTAGQMEIPGVRAVKVVGTMKR
jgi:hypothetical protein